MSDEASPDDILATYEAKAKLTGTMEENKLQEAIDGSAKDFHVRTGESLNALKRRLIRNGNKGEASRVKRFQNRTDRPYKVISGSAVFLSHSVYDSSLLSQADASAHPNNSNVNLIIFRGDDLMPLVHDLYRRAADEA